MLFQKNNLTVLRRPALVLAGLLFSTLIMAQQTDSTILEGKLTRAQIESYSWFKQQYNAYKPSLSVVEQLVNYPKCSLLVVLGTWCSDSHELVPQLFKVADLAGWDKIEIIGVDKKKQCSSVDITPLKIEYVPVIMLFKDKKLVGRIVETTEKSIEEDLLKLLQETNK